MTYELAASTWGKEEIDAIHRVIASDRYTMGANVARLEEEFAAYLTRAVRSYADAHVRAGIHLHIRVPAHASEC